MPEFLQQSLVALGEALTIQEDLPCLVIIMNAVAAAKSLQLCLTLCDPIDNSPPDFPIPGILQARTLEWVAISFSNAWKWKVKVKLLSHVRLLATAWTAASQAPPSMGFSRQEYWRGVPLPSPSWITCTNFQVQCPGLSKCSAVPSLFLLVLLLPSLKICSFLYHTTRGNMTRHCHLSVSEFVGWSMEQIFIEHLLCANHCSRHWDHSPG